VVIDVDRGERRGLRGLRRVQRARRGMLQAEDPIPRWPVWEMTGSRRDPDGRATWEWITLGG